MSTVAVVPGQAQTDAVPSVVANAAAPVAGRCPSCDQALAGEYCHRCGERDPAAVDWSLRHFFRETAGDLFDLDSKAVRSVRALLFRPGFLTLEHLRGRRRGYVGPLRLFVVIFAVMIFGMPLVEKAAAGKPVAGAEAQEGLVNAQIQLVVERVAARRGETAEAAKRELVAQVTRTISWFAVLVPLTFGVVVHALFRRRRRWFAENLVFATHFAAFNYLLGILLVPVQLGLGRLGNTGMVLLVLLIFAAALAYMALAVQRVYETTRTGSVVRALVLMVGFSAAQMITSLLALCTAAVVLIYL